MYYILIIRYVRFYEPCILQVFWLKNGKPIDSKKDINFIITSEGNLLINQARLIDTGNYTCGAQNLANRRLSEPAALSVIGEYFSWKTLIYSYCVISPILNDEITRLFIFLNLKT